MNGSGSGSETVYVIRYRRRAQTDVEEVLVGLAETTDYVCVLHIRHGSRKPMTRTEARKMDDEE